MTVGDAALVLPFVLLVCLIDLQERSATVKVLAQGPALRKKLAIVVPFDAGLSEGLYFEFDEFLVA